MATDKLEAPDFQIDADFRSHYVVRAGTSLRLFVLYHGRPRPTVCWSKPDIELQEKAEITTTDYSTLLLINSTTREDSGKYTLMLESSAGQKTLHLTVKVLGKGCDLSCFCIFMQKMLFYPYIQFSFYS